MLTNAFSQLLFYRPKGNLTNYTISFTAVGIAIAIELLLYGFDITYLGLLFWLYAAILVSALLGGLYSGLASIAFSLVVILCFTLVTVPVRMSSTREIQTLVFILFSFITSYVISAVKSTYQITISILNSLQTFTLILNPKGQIVDVNQTTLEQFGLKRSTLVGRSVLSSFGISYSEEHRRKLRQALIEAREGGHPRFDIKITSPTKKTFYVDLSISPIYDRQGNVISLVASGNDITARVISERKVLKLNETLEQKISELETLFKLLPIGIGVAYKDSQRKVRINPAFARMLNLPTKDTLATTELEKNPHYKFVKNGRTQKSKELPMNIALNKGLSIQESEVQIVQPGNQVVDVLQYAMPIRDEDQEIIGSIGAFVDITEFKQIETELQESQSKFKALLNANLIGVIVAKLDPSGAIIEANDAFCSMTGYTLAEIKAGKVSWKTLTPPEYVETDMISLSELLKKGETKPYEKEYIRRDGTRLPILIGAALADSDKKTSVAFILDLSARKKLERRKDEFIGLASHELKTPLTSMKVFTQLLQRSLTPTKSRKGLEYITKINRQIERLTTLVEELLDVSKIEAGQLQLNLEKFDPYQLVTEIVSEVQAITPHHTLKVIGSFKSDITGDAFRIKQVLLNLLTNAVKYSPQAKEVLITLTEDMTKVCIAVTDHGVGIPEVDQKRIFEKFFRAGGKNKHSFPGLGLGLYLSKRIIERHGGKIWLESQEGKGSTFSFSLLKKVT